MKCEISTPADLLRIQFKSSCVEHLINMGFADCALALSFAEVVPTPRRLYNAITLRCGDKRDAGMLYRQQYSFFAKKMAEWTYQKLHFTWKGFTVPLTVLAQNENIQPRRRTTGFNSLNKHAGDFNMIQASQEIISTPGLQIAQMRLSLPIIRVLETFLEHPERRSGLVRASDQRQVAMTESSVIMTPRKNLVEAVQYTRDDYMFEGDKEGFYSQLNALEPNNPDSYAEIRYRADVNHTNYRWFTTKYWRVTDAFGEVYDVGQNLGIDEIPVPRMV